MCALRPLKAALSTPYFHLCDYLWFDVSSTYVNFIFIDFEVNAATVILSINKIFIKPHQQVLTNTEDISSVFF